VRTGVMPRPPTPAPSRVALLQRPLRRYRQRH
jgi:hypothetical protein